MAVDDVCKAHGPRTPHPGPAGGLTTSAVVTLAIHAQATRLPAARACPRQAPRCLRPLVPGLPSRDRLNRLVRACGETITAFALHVGQARAVADERSFEAIDGTRLGVRTANRRGAGWLCGQADIGWCPRLGWDEGRRLLLSVTPAGAVTGWGIGPASTTDRVLAETFVAGRGRRLPHLPGVGVPTSDCAVADMGCSGKAGQRRWRVASDAVVISPPQRDRQRAWPKRLKTWLAGIRQVIEAVTDRLLFTCGLDRERPHALDGLQARLAAAIGRHNVCCWLHRRRGRGPVQVADLIAW